MTGKGFPDFDTIRILQTLLTSTKIKAVYLGDLDPYGLLIYLDYCRKIPRPVQFIGLGSSDVQDLVASAGVPVSCEFKFLVISAVEKRFKCLEGSRELRDRDRYSI